MTFECNKIVYSSPENWDEIVNITFVQDNYYLSFNSLVYEDEIGIELNEQTNFINVLKKDFNYKLVNDKLIINISNPLLQNNLFETTFEICFSNVNLDKLDEALTILISFSSD